MNEMRKLMETIQQINENIIPVKYKGKIIGNIWENRAAKPDSIDRWHGEHSGTGMSWSTDNYKDIVAMVVDHHEDTINEANQGGKTEHSGAKKGKGAYHGREKEFMGRLKHGKRFRRKAKTQVGEEIVEIIGEGRQFVDSAAMVRWMLSGLKKIQYDFQFTDDAEELFDNLMDEIDNLIEEMENAEIKTYPSRPTHGRSVHDRAIGRGRRPGPRR